MDAVGVMEGLSSCEKAVKDSSAALWDHCAAVLIGDMKNSVYGRAQKRGANYGTQTGGVAHANTAMIAALNAGMSAANKDKVLQQVYVTYVQASLRYAWKVDDDIAGVPRKEVREHQGEGAAFFRIVAPLTDKDGAAAIEKMYKVDSSIDGTPNQYFCATKATLDSSFPDLVSLTGTLEKTEDIDCANPTAGGTPAAGTPAAGTPAAKEESAAGTASLAALGAAAALALAQN